VIRDKSVMTTDARSHRAADDERAPRPVARKVVRGAPVRTVANKKEQGKMGRIVVTEYVSLDGVIEAPGGAEDFKHAGWTFQFDRGEAGTQFKLDETLQSEALLLGRKTYDVFAATWPTMTDEMGFADKFNSMPKYVVSSTLTTASWNNSTIIRGDVVAEVSRLRQATGGDIVVHGSGQLVRALLEHDMVDELRLMVFPVVLGAGQRLFGDTTDKKRLQLTDSRVVGDGVVILVYTG
jgi:dihydrofolate reductase